MNFDMDMLPGNHHIKIWNISITSETSLLPLCSQASTHTLGARQRPTCFLTPWLSLDCFRIWYKWDQTVCTFYVCFLLLSTTFLRSVCNMNYTTCCFFCFKGKRTGLQGTTSRASFWSDGRRLLTQQAWLSYIRSLARKGRSLLPLWGNKCFHWSRWFLEERAHWGRQQTWAAGRGEWKKKGQCMDQRQTSPVK